MTLLNNVPLRDKNWFQTGGNARYYCEPTDAREFKEALIHAQQKQLDLFILGQGANILISDDGFDGLVIRPQLLSITKNTTDTIPFVTAGAGVTIADLIEWCFDNGITGLEEFSGIPGTVGGSVYINLHYFSYLLDQFLVKATVIEKSSGTLMVVDHQWFNFGYDQSTLQNQEYYLVDATFALNYATPHEIAFARGRSKEIIRHRYARYPYKNTCGSFFRNFHENEVTIVSNGKKMIYAAYYLDKVGVKGELSHNDAQVSYQHANMLVNTGNASSNDIIQVARKMQEKVYNSFNLMLQPECQLIGFQKYPLYKG